MSCFIDWCAFTWEAFATLTTGALAVGGALVIGLKQLRITARQTDIARRQAEVAERQADLLNHQVAVDLAAVRGNLFERRFAVYKACKEYIKDAMAVRVDFDTDMQKTADLSTQLEQAEFLFSRDVRESLRAIVDEADDYLTEREKMRDLRQSDTVDGDIYDAQAAKVRDRRKELRERLSLLSEAMGEEMKLYVPEP